MASDNKNIQALYNSLKSDGYSNLGTSEDFANTINDPENRKILYNTIKGDYNNIGDFGSFESRLGYGNTGQGKSAPQSVSPSYNNTNYVQQRESYDPLSAYATSPEEASKPIVKHAGEVVDPTDAKIRNIRQQAAEIKQKAQSQQDYDLQKYYDEQKKENPGGLMGFMKELGNAMARQHNVGADMPELYDTNIQKDKATIKKVENTARMAESAAKEKNGNFAGGAVRGISDKMADPNYYTNGLGNLMDADAVLMAVKKKQNGEVLTAQDQTVLDAASLEAYANGELQDKLGHGYKMGQTTAESMAYMPEFILNPASGLGKAAVSAVTKKFGVEVAKSLGKKLLTKALPRVAGDFAAGTVMAGTTDFMKTAANATERMTGDVQPTTDENGYVQYNGVKNAETPLNAIRKSVGSTIANDASEFSGEYFSPIGRLIGEGAGKLTGKLGMANATKLMQNISNGQWARLSKEIENNTHWSGNLSEWGEEQVGTLYDSILSGDSSLKDLTNWNQQLDTFLGVSGFGGFMSTVKTGAYGYVQHENSKKLNEQKNIMQSDKKTAPIVEQLDNADDKRMIDILSNVLHSGDYTDKQKQNTLLYAGRLKTYQGSNLADFKRNTEGETEQDYLDTASNFNAGYQIAEKDAATKRNAYTTLQKYKDQVPEEFASANENERLDMMRKAHDSGEDTSNLMKYHEAKSIYDGMIYGIRDMIDEKVSLSNSVIDKRTNKNSGNILMAASNTDPSKPMYIVSGNTVMNSDGTINAEASDKSLVAINDNGETVMVSPSDMTILSEMNADEMKRQQEQMIRQEEATRHAAEIETPTAEETDQAKDNELSNIQQGSEITVNINGVPIKANIQNITSDGKYVVNFGQNKVEIGNGKPTQVFDAQQLKQLLIPKEQQSTEQQPTQTEPTAEPQQPTQKEQPTSVSKTETVVPESNAQTETEAEQNPVQTLEEYTKTLPAKKNGQLDFKNFTPEQRYTYTSLKFDDKTALKDLEDEISERNKEIENIKKKLAKATPTQRLNLRDELDTKQKELDRINTFHESVKPAPEVAPTDNTVTEPQNVTTEQTAPQTEQQPTAEQQPVTEQQPTTEQPPKEEPKEEEPTPEPTKENKTSKKKKGEGKTIVIKPRKSTGKGSVYAYVGSNEPYTLRESLLVSIASGAMKFRWSNSQNSATRGLAAHLGYTNSMKEMRSRIWMLSNKEGYYPEVAAERFFANLTDDQKAMYGVEDERDVFAEILDICQSYTKPSEMWEAARKIHEENSPEGMLQKEQERYDREMLEMAADAYNIDPEEYDAYMESIQKDAEEMYNLQNEDGYKELESKLAEEYINSKEHGREETEPADGVQQEVHEGQKLLGGTEGSVQVLPGRENTNAGAVEANKQPGQEGSGGTENDSNVEVHNPPVRTEPQRQEYTGDDRVVADNRSKEIDYELSTLDDAIEAAKKQLQAEVKKLGSRYAADNQSTIFGEKNKGASDAGMFEGDDAANAVHTKENQEKVLKPIKDEIARLEAKRKNIADTKDEEIRKAVEANRKQTKTGLEEQPPTHNVISAAEKITEQNKSNGEEVRFRKSENKESINEDLTPEEKQIAQDAKANGTYLKAPNGKDTNLSPKQWLQVRTKAFKNWFGDWENDPDNASKIVDENGEPKVVYHGSLNAGFTVFDDTASRKNSNAPEGTYWFSDSDRAMTYSGTREESKAGKWERGNYAVFLNIRNPYTVDMEGATWEGDLIGKVEMYDTSESDSWDNPVYKEDGSRYFNSREEAEQYARDHGIKKYDIHEDPFFGQGVNDIVQEAIGLGDNDGVIIKNVIDNGGYGNDEISDDYIAYTPNQIKSATENNGEFSNGNEDIRFRQEIPSSTLSSDEYMASAVQDMADKLHTSINIVYDTNEINDPNPEIQKQKRESKGWYENGTVTVVVQNNDNASDAVATVLHEVVAHKGLRDMFGKKFNDFLSNVYHNSTGKIRSEINALMQKNNWDFREATDEYIASLAERGFDAEDKKTFWQSVRQFFHEMLNKAGISTRINDEDIRSILYQSYNLKTGDIVKQATAIALRGRAAASHGSVRDVRFRKAKEELDNLDAKSTYEFIMGQTKTKLNESYVDSVNSIRIAQNAIIKETNEELLDFENAYLAENRKSSINKTQWEEFRDMLFRPIALDTEAIVKKTGCTIDDVSRYAMLKHGLERNMTFAFRDCMESVRNNKAAAGLFNQNKLDAMQKDYDDRVKKERESLDNGTIDYNTYLDNVDKIGRDILGTSYEAYRKNDYSALAATTGAVKNYETVAKDVVSSFESKCSEETKKLWEDLDNANKFAIDKLYKSGMIGREAKTRLDTMFRFYVPLRGFKDKTAEDLYYYINSQGQSAFDKPLQKANGRKTVADNPFANVAMIAANAIAQANKNIVKQHFYNMVVNHPTSLFTVSKAWYRNMGTEDNPNWVLSTPDILEGMTQEEKNKAMEDHEDLMKKLEETGMATTDKGRLKVDYLIKSEKDRDQHLVVVKVAGKDYVIYTNANPRVAQAVNGLTNPESPDKNGIESFMDTMNHFMAGMFTAQNPAFILTNLSRDVSMSLASTFVIEDMAYNREFRKHLANNVGKMWRIPELLKKYNGGMLDMNNPKERLFKEFMENGGETGYTNMQTVDDYKRIFNDIARMADGKTGSAEKAIRILPKSIEYLNRSAEDIVRFTCYETSRHMGRSIERSIKNAKDVSVNFNKKGSGVNYGTGFWTNILYGSNWFRHLYLFFNASVQSLTKVGIMAKSSMPKLLMVGAGAIAAGSMIPLLNDLLISLTGGDDDKKAYDDLPDWVRKNNLVLYVPFSKKKFVTLPLAIELRSLYGLGELTAQIYRGNVRTETAKDKSNIALETLGQFSDLMPLDVIGNGENVASNISPASVKPFIEAAMNKDYYGKPIYKDQEYNRQLPAYMKAYSGTSSQLVDICKKLNDMTGEGGAAPGVINLNPALIEHYFEGYFGGTGRTYLQVVKMIQAAAGNEDMQSWRNVPILNRFVSSSNDEKNAFSRINTAYYSYRDEATETSNMEKYDKDQDNNSMQGFAERLSKLYNSPRYDRMEVFKSYEKQIDQLNKQLKNETDKDLHDQLYKEMSLLKAEAVEELDGIKDK